MTTTMLHFIVETHISKLFCHSLTLRSSKCRLISNRRNLLPNSDPLPNQVHLGPASTRKEIAHRSDYLDHHRFSTTLDLIEPLACCHS